MIQCRDCDLCDVAPDGGVQFRCNPFTNIKEPECLLKHQLLRLDMMTRAYVSTIAEYRKIAPLQERLYRHMSREMDEMDDADSWKQPPPDESDKNPGAGPDLPPLDDRL
jgi:hypothetical protein